MVVDAVWSSGVGIGGGGDGGDSDGDTNDNARWQITFPNERKKNQLQAVKAPNVIFFSYSYFTETDENFTIYAGVLCHLRNDVIRSELKVRRRHEK